jgi:hypothetical protein
MPPAAYYLGPIDRFRATSPTAILGHIQQHTEFDTELAQRDAWLVQIATLQQSLDGLSGFVLMEFIVPRIGSRIDAVVIVGPIVFVLEFKVGATDYTRDHRNQVWDYALDLKYFHRASHDASIVPILVATEAAYSDTRLGEPFIDSVFPPALSNAEGLRQLMDDGIRRITGVSIDPISWAQAPYKPTPTIIEAARTLYAQHSVDEISRSDAGARNLALTSSRIEALIDEARAAKVKIIALVTGVPGAGKTLVGLNIATKKHDQALETHAVFLSGNDPLVLVLREALIRDAFRQLADKSKRQERMDIRHEVKAFIQNVHHFRDAGVRDPDGPPADRVVIFDEAQRAWNREMTSEFMRRKKGVPEFNQSEPEFLISYMDRHPDWAVVVCLVGGGQEINRGEAGISAWLDAVREHFADWRVYVSPELTDSEYAAGQALQRLSGRGNVHEDIALHLAVSMRSFRAENVSGFVKAILDCEVEDARELLRRFVDRYPIAITRNLQRAKRWVREHARGSERYGLVASSGAQRLKPHAIDVRVNINPVHWFLNEMDDTRSSYYLEDAATEFQVQGLELDWVCVTWDADLRFGSPGWRYHSFLGKRWTNVNKHDRRQYLLNAYRVLLTRARQGMVICVPEGETADPTRNPDFYDPTFDYLVAIGIPVLQ